MKLPRSKIFRYLVLPGMVVALITTLVWWFHRDPLALPQIRSLPDGSLLSLEGVSWGREHNQKVEAGTWLNKLVKLLPDAWEDRFGGGIKQANLKFSTPDSLLLFMFAREKTPDALARMRVLLRDDVGEELRDEAGNEYEGGWLINTWGMNQGGRALTWRFDAFPRRHPYLTVEMLVWRSEKKAYVAEAQFRFPNPAYRKTFPQWPAETAPLTQSLGGLTVTLDEFVTGDVPGSSVASLRLGTTNLTRWRFKLAQGDSPALDWDYHSLRVADATGNEWNPDDQIHAWLTPWEIQVPGALWREEHAWKTTLEVVRRQQFAAEDLHPLPLLEVPTETDQTTALNITNEWLGMNMAISAVRTAEQLVLNVKHNPLLLGASLWALVNVTGETGKPLAPEDVTDWSPGERQFTFMLPPGAGQVAVTLARAEHRRFEFVAQPKRLVLGKVIDSEGRR